MNTNITTIEECPLKKYNIPFFFFYRNRFHENTVRRKNFFFGIQSLNSQNLRKSNIAQRQMNFQKQKLHGMHTKSKNNDTIATEKLNVNIYMNGF